MAVLAALKHFNPRYLVPALVVVPFAVVSFRRFLPGMALAALLAGTVALDVHVARSEHARIVRERAALVAYRAEIERVRALPAQGLGIRAWTYKALAPEYGISFVNDIANQRFLDPVVYRAWFPWDRGFFRDVPYQVPWAYAVYPRQFFPRVEDVPEGVRAVSEVAFEGEHLLVLRRAALTPAPHSPR
jgi:hypothetical protein